MLPADAGCIVDNVDTVISIYMAVCKSTPLMRKIITVTGDAVADPRNFSVKLEPITRSCWTQPAVLRRSRKRFCQAVP